jgi:predicted outer membrane repeat protein
MVSFVASSGAISNLTSTWATGTASAAYSSTLSTSGTLTICPGTYYVELSIRGADIAVIGRDGSGATSLVGDGTGPVMAVSSACSDLAVQGLTLTGGDAGTSQGGGIHAGTHGVDLVVDDVVIQDCDAISGGGIYQAYGSLTGTDLTVQGCAVDNYGGGIYLNSVAVDLSSSTIEDNYAATQYGGGIYAANCTVAFDGVTVSRNDCPNYAGGAFLYNGTATIVSSTFDANTAYRGAGLMVWGGSAAITSSDLTNNVADYNAGGLYVTYGAVTLSDSRVDGNSAGSMSGGVFLNNSSTLACYGTSTTTAGIYDNTAYYYGGGVHFYDTGSRLTSSVCDWGQSTYDNSPDDLAIGTSSSTGVQYKNYHSDESFSCTISGCR